MIKLEIPNNATGSYLIQFTWQIVRLSSKKIGTQNTILTDTATDIEKVGHTITPFYHHSLVSRPIPEVK